MLLNFFRFCLPWISLTLGLHGSLCVCLWLWFRVHVSWWLHFYSHFPLSLVSLSLFLIIPCSRWLLPISGRLWPPWLAGSGAVCGWGSPRLLQRGTRISNTCSLWQRATTAHCLPTSHFNLKRENCQTNVLATAPCQGCMGNLTAAPARSLSCEGIGKGARGCLVLVGGPGCHPPWLHWF